MAAPVKSWTDEGMNFEGLSVDRLTHLDWRYASAVNEAIKEKSLLYAVEFNLPEIKPLFPSDYNFFNRADWYIGELFDSAWFKSVRMSTHKYIKGDDIGGSEPYTWDTILKDAGYAGGINDKIVISPNRLDYLDYNQVSDWFIQRKKILNLMPWFVWLQQGNSYWTRSASGSDWSSVVADISAQPFVKETPTVPVPAPSYISAEITGPIYSCVQKRYRHDKFIALNGEFNVEHQIWTHIPNFGAENNDYFGINPVWGKYNPIRTKTISVGVQDFVFPTSAYSSFPAPTAKMDCAYSSEHVFKGNITGGFKFI